MAGRWYKNLNLDRQLGLEVSCHFGPEIGGQPDKESEGEVNFAASYLWAIADRLSWEPKIMADVEFAKVKPWYEETSSWFSEQEYTIAAPLKYFIEDQVVLSVGATYIITRMERQPRRHLRENRWYLHFGVLYHFDRHLH